MTAILHFSIRLISNVTAHYGIADKIQKASRRPAFVNHQENCLPRIFFPVRKICLCIILPNDNRCHPVEDWYPEPHFARNRPFRS